MAVSKTRTIWIILLYSACVVIGVLAGLIASAVIVRSAAGPNCCAPGDGILAVLCAIILVPSGVVLSILFAATVLRVRRQAENSQRSGAIRTAS